MLYKNDEPYTLTQEEVKMYSGKVKYIYTPDKIKYDREDERIRKPNSIILEPFYTYFDKKLGSSCQLRYVKSSQSKREGGVTFTEYTPSEITFSQRGVVEVVNDPEYNMFMALHPQNQDSPNADPKRQAVFMLENKEAEAKKRVLAQSKLFEAKALIHHPTESLNEKDLRALARTYPDLVGYADQYNIDQIRDELDKKATNDPAGFLRQARDQRSKVLALVMQAKQLDLINYVNGRRTWVSKEKGVEKDTICVVKQGKDPQDTLLDYLIFDDKKGFLDFFTRMVEQSTEAATQDA